MIFEIQPYQKENLPEVQLPDKEFLNVLGEEGIRKLISNHYNLLRKSKINHLFPIDDKGFEQAKLNSSDFFIQIMGGPRYFDQNRGKPMLAVRHAAFKISPEARFTWLECYCEVLKNLEVEEKVLSSFWNYLNVLSMRMVNSEDDKPEFIFKFKK
jgi:hemoglobin